LSDLFLNFTGYFFSGTVTLRLWIIDDVSCHFLYHTLYVMKLAIRLVLRAGFHGISPVAVGDLPHVRLFLFVEILKPTSRSPDGLTLQRYYNYHAWGKLQQLRGVMH
jgi:hypothetical protein